MVAFHLSSSTLLFTALMASLTLASAVPQRLNSNLLLRDGSSSDEVNSLAPHQDTPPIPASPNFSGPVVAVTQNTGTPLVQPAPVSDGHALAQREGTQVETNLQNITGPETLTMDDRVEPPPILPRDDPTHVGISKNRVEFAHKGESFDMSQHSGSTRNGPVDFEHHQD